MQQWQLISFWDRLAILFQISQKDHEKQKKLSLASKDESLQSKLRPAHSQPTASPSDPSAERAADCARAPRLCSPRRCTPKGPRLISHHKMQYRASCCVCVYGSSTSSDPTTPQLHNPTAPKKRITNRTRCPKIVTGGRSRSLLAAARSWPAHEAVQKTSDLMKASGRHAYSYLRR